MSLVLYSGARASEVLHVELKNLDIENRWFKTTVKSRKKDKRDGIYFFPEFFIPELEKYVKKLDPEDKYLFPQGNSYLSIKTIDQHMRGAKQRLGIPCKTKPHAFRNFLNEQRIEMKLLKNLGKSY